MNNDKPTFKRLLTESMDEEAKSLHRHPTRQELLDFRDGNLAQDVENELMAHLGLCRDCSHRLLIMSRQGIGARLLALLSGGAQLGHYRNAVGGFAVAVAIVLPTVMWQQAERVKAELVKPQINVEIFQVKRPIRGEAGPISTFEVGADDHRFVIVLPVEDEYEEYEIGILSSGGREIWRSRGLRLDSHRVQVRLELSQHFLGAGDYLFEVSGIDGEKRQSPVEYRVCLMVSDGR